MTENIEFHKYTLYNNTGYTVSDIEISPVKWIDFLYLTKTCSYTESKENTWRLI